MLDNGGVRQLLREVEICRGKCDRERWQGVRLVIYNPWFIDHASSRMQNSQHIWRRPNRILITGLGLCGVVERRKWVEVGFFYFRMSGLPSLRWERCMAGDKDNLDNESHIFSLDLWLKSPSLLPVPVKRLGGQGRIHVLVYLVCGVTPHSSSSSRFLSSRRGPRCRGVNKKSSIFVSRSGFYVSLK